MNVRHPKYSAVCSNIVAWAFSCEHLAIRNELDCQKWAVCDEWNSWVCVWSERNSGHLSSSHNGTFAFHRWQENSMGFSCFHQKGPNSNWGLKYFSSRSWFWQDRCGLCQLFEREDDIYNILMSTVQWVVLLWGVGTVIPSSPVQYDIWQHIAPDNFCQLCQQIGSSFGSHSRIWDRKSETIACKWTESHEAYIQHSMPEL